MTSHEGFQGKPVRGQPVLAQNEQRWGSGTSWAVSESRDTTCGYTLVLGPALRPCRAVWNSRLRSAGAFCPALGHRTAGGSVHTPPQSTGLHPSLGCKLPSPRPGCPATSPGLGGPAPTSERGAKLGFMVVILDIETTLQCTPGGIPNQDRTQLVPEAGTHVAQAPGLLASTF